MKILKFVGLVFLFLSCFESSGQGFLHKGVSENVPEEFILEKRDLDFIKTEDGNYLAYWNFSTFGFAMGTALEKISPEGKVIWKIETSEILEETISNLNHGNIFETSENYITFHPNEAGLTKRIFSKNGEFLETKFIKATNTNQLITSRINFINDETYFVSTSGSVHKFVRDSNVWTINEYNSGLKINADSITLLKFKFYETEIKFFDTSTGDLLNEIKILHEDVKNTSTSFNEDHIYLLGYHIDKEFLQIIITNRGGIVEDTIYYPYSEHYQTILNSDTSGYYLTDYFFRNIKNLTINQLSFSDSSITKKDLNYPLGDPKTKRESPNEYLFSGSQPAAIGFGARKAVFIVTDSTFRLPINRLTGRVAFDNNLNCLADSTESGPYRWKIKIESSNDTTYILTESNGEFSTILSDTSYTVSLLTPGNLWMPCQSSYQIDFQGITDTFELDIPVQPLKQCPLMQVDIGTDRLTPCERSIYSGTYSNIGTDTAFGATLDVTFDPNMTILDSSLPIAGQVGNTFTFNLGDVAPGGFDFFNILIELSCNGVLANQSHCVNAHIFPDTICNTTWQGSNIEVTSDCKTDTITFFIKNVGNQMQNSSPYIVIEDDIILRIGTFQLDAGAMREVPVPVKLGSTYRLEAEQEIGFPDLLGGTPASVTLENCTLNSSGFPAGGVVNQFEQDDAEPFLSNSCIQNTSDSIFREKRGFPEGFGSEHFIKKNQDLEYTLSFQNKSPDTVRQVIIRDTLSRFLDIASVEALSASHLYDFEIYNGNILKFTFDNLTLPPSGENESASRGFVKFRCRPVVDSPIGSVIFNAADLYLNSPTPKTTNRTDHKIGEDFIQIITAVFEKGYENFQIKAVPNPFSETVFIKIENSQNQSFKYYLSDISGRKIRSGSLTQNSFVIERNDLPSGLYFLMIRTAENLPIATLKIVCD